jgi:arginine-tRNA-protein transferase
VPTSPGIRIFHTVEHVCGYWPERLARDLVLDPDDTSLPELYESALAMGFRRSGGHVYRPHCDACRACTPVRVPVADFVPNRAQRRCLARNADLSVEWREAERTDENFSLYQRYLGARHPGGGMDSPEPEAFDRFLACTWSPTRFLELRRDGELLAIAATDVLTRAFSAVYTFYAPEHAARSLGRFAILSQIEQARQMGREYHYLGFWLDAHPKMDYKREYQPLEFFDGSRWQRFTSPAAPATGRAVLPG